MTSGVARPHVGIALPSRPLRNVGERFAELTARTVESVRATFRASPDRQRRKHYPSQREEFVESAAMAREMYRL